MGRSLSSLGGRLLRALLRRAALDAFVAIFRRCSAVIFPSRPTTAPAIVFDAAGQSAASLGPYSLLHPLGQRHQARGSLPPDRRLGDHT